MPKRASSAPRPTGGKTAGGTRREPACENVQTEVQAILAPEQRPNQGMMRIALFSAKE